MSSCYLKSVRVCVIGSLLLAASAVQAESISAKVTAPSDVAVQVRPVGIHPSCQLLGTAQQIIDGVQANEFSCAASTRGLICVRATDGLTTNNTAIARKLAQGGVLNRMELNAIDTVMYAGLDMLLVSTSNGVRELQRALRAPNDTAMANLLRVNRNRGFVSVSRESAQRPYFPPGASAVVENAIPLSVGRDLYYFSDLTVNAGSTIDTPDSPSIDYMAIRSNRLNGTAIIIGTGVGPYKCSAQGWKAMADAANIESLDKPKVVIVDTRIRRRNSL